MFITNIRIFYKRFHCRKTMFKPGSGRKLESDVLKYFIYETATDKSRGCVISTVAGEDGEKHECGSILGGKNATNLKSHLRSKHKDVFTTLQNQEKLKKHPADKASVLQTKLTLKVRHVFCFNMLV